MINDGLVKRSLEVYAYRKFQMAKSDKRRLREVRYTGKRRLRGVVFFSGPQQYIWYVEVLRKTCNKGDRAFYDAISNKYQETTK